MREIKFRAWDVESKNFQYSKNMNGPDRDCDGGWWGDCVLDYTTEYPILQQFTDLKDKNGKEIYEGDIVEDAYHVKMTIEWEECGFYLKREYISETPLRLNFNTWLEVIGNIYENKELLSAGGGAR